ncbi:MAG: hypothetical protein ACR2LI_01585 [Propionibacteriaceae bacterium]
MADLFGVGRSTIYRSLLRARSAPTDPLRPFGESDSTPHGSAR